MRLRIGLIAALLAAPALGAQEPPTLAAPDDATVLFGGGDRGAWTSAEGWRMEGRALVAGEGAGPLDTREDLGDVHVHVDYLVPDGLEESPGAVLLAARYAVPLDADGPRGSWRRLDLTYSHRPGEPPRISAWLDDVRVLTDARPEGPSEGGLAEPVPGSVLPGDARFVADARTSAACDWGGTSFAVAAEFRTRGSGTLVSKCPPEGPWVPDAKALFLRGGRLVYDIGWVGALTSNRRWDDGQWHRVVLTSDEGVARLYVDGELEGERADFAAPDEGRFRLKVGAANDNFAGAYDGDVRGVRFYDRGLPPHEASALSASGDDEPERTPTWTWEPGEGLPPPPEDGILRAPVRLSAAPGVRFANVWTRPMEEVDHAALVASWDERAEERGRMIYSGLCVTCHGRDGTKPTNPKARPFALGVLENGIDPLSLFRTVTSGYKEMPSNAHLTPAQRYDVIHYVRESFFRERNPSQFFPVDDAYLNALPKGRLARHVPRPDELPPRDFGPALSSSLGSAVGTCLTVRLDPDATIAYDLQLMESPGAWTGGFLDLTTTQHYQQRGEGLPEPDGEPLPGLEGWAWGHAGTLDWDRARRPERGPLPREWLDYHGHHVHGERIVLSYAIDRRAVLEVPGVDRSSGMPVITHRLRIGPGGSPLVLALAAAPEGTGAIVSEDGLLVAGDADGASVAAAVLGDARLVLDPEGRLVATFPPADEAREVLVLRHAARTPAHLAGFRVYLDNVRERPLPPSPATLRGGGPARWPEELVTQGQLGDESGPYTVDTLTLPVNNPWNAWLRTSALDFFADGRCAVATYGGDVWIVSGIDEDLDELRWRRFAAGLFEPMGLRVIDGLVYVTCRDRIVRLEDRNGDGEADFYGSFFPDPDVTATFHAFNFDLQTDPDGNLYYAKSGQYTRFALPGAVLKVAPDGRSYEVHCTGLRTPNGMGMSPDGRPLVSDNQGNWIPASKVTLTRPGGFYGVFKAINVGTPGIQTRDDFDPPVIWMPQRLDSSSGGQLWVDDPRFGPLAGRYLHTSFGKGWMYALVIDESVAEPQGAVWRLPLWFAAGLQRLRQSPADGQVYTVGLSGWQGPAGGADGCLQRVRYTGAPGTLLLDARATREGVELTFSDLLDPALAADPARYEARRWNYRWARDYGSAHYSLERPGEEGEDPVAVHGVRLGERGCSVFVELEDMVPVQQLWLRYDLRDAAGHELVDELYLTVNVLPE